jgi:hypothetical protein
MLGAYGWATSISKDGSGTKWPRSTTTSARSAIFIVGLFALSWIVLIAFYRWRRFDELELAPKDSAMHRARDRRGCLQLHEASPTSSGRNF